MKTKKSRLRKILLLLTSIIIIIPVLVIIFISPITKYLLEKYSMNYLGRQVKMSWAYVNPFTGHVRLNSVKIYEPGNDTVFLSVQNIYVDFAMLKWFSRTCEITSITLDKPAGVIVLNKRDHVNFDDIIEKFTPKHTTPSKNPFHVNIYNMKINNGVFYFRDPTNAVNYLIKDFEFDSKGKSSDADTIVGKISFSSGIGTGTMDGHLSMNFNTLDYRYDFIAHKYDMGIIQQYLKQIINYGTFSANFDADLNSAGNFKDAGKQDIKGQIAINEFHFGKTPEIDYLSFDKFAVGINEISPEKNIYDFDSIALTKPYFKYEQYDHLNNVETILGQGVSNVYSTNSDKDQYNIVIEFGHYLIKIFKNFFQSNYKINNVKVTSGNIHFDDYSSSEEFSISANPLSIWIDSVKKSTGRIKILVKSEIKPYGSATIYANINPRDSEDFSIVFHLAKVPMSVFNPYIIAFTSFPFKRGTISLDGDWKVLHGNLQSENHLLVVDPYVATHIKNKGIHWLPMRLVMFLLRGSGNVMDYQIPVTGNTKNPMFHLRDVIFGALKNILLKPITTPYRLKVAAQDNIIDKSLSLSWAIRQSVIPSDQQKFIKKLVDFMVKNPTAAITLSPEIYTEKEREYILFFEAKKKYFLMNNPGKTNLFSSSDSEKVEKMSIKDSVFVKYLDKHYAHSLVFTIQGKCANYVGIAIVNNKFNRLNKERETNFLSSFKESGVANRVTFSIQHNVIPFNGFSFYKITYKGDLPDYLVKANKELEGLNDEPPREKYKKERGN